MRPRQLKQAAATPPVSARMVSDGCREYVVEVVSEHGAGLLRHRRGRTLRFRNLGQIHEMLRNCGVREAVLRARVADDETSSAPSSFHDLPLRRPH